MQKKSHIRVAMASAVLLSSFKVRFLIRLTASLILHTVANVTTYGGRLVVSYSSIHIDFKGLVVSLAMCRRVLKYVLEKYTIPSR